MLARIRRALHSAKLKADVRAGRKTWGRQGYATIEAVVIRADGTQENLGVVAEGEVLFRPESK